MSKIFGTISIITGIGGIVISLFISGWLWAILGATAIITGAIGVNKDDTKTLSIIGIVFGIHQIFIFIGFLILLHIFGSMYL